jgi:hypothetical protein
VKCLNQKKNGLKSFVMDSYISKQYIFIPYTLERSYKAMKKYFIKTVLLLTVMTFTIPITAEASKTLDGWMQGFNCVRHGHRCPIDGLDPHLMFEPDFVCSSIMETIFCCRTLPVSLRPNMCINQFGLSAERIPDTNRLTSINCKSRMATLIKPSGRRK